jgi:hypothetical protein
VSPSYGNSPKLKKKIPNSGKFVNEPHSWYSDYATGWATGVQFRTEIGKGLFLFATVSRPAVGPIQPPLQWVPRALALAWPGLEADL